MSERKSQRAEPLDRRRFLEGAVAIAGAGLGVRSARGAEASAPVTPSAFAHLAVRAVNLDEAVDFYDRVPRCRPLHVARGGAWSSYTAH